MDHIKERSKPWYPNIGMFYNIFYLFYFFRIQSPEKTKTYNRNGQNKLIIKLKLYDQIIKIFKIII